MYRSITIANYFIMKALECGDYLTPMKLVKLVYIAHGWYLGLGKQDGLIKESVIAYKYGPVIHNVYHAFKKYGNTMITEPEPIHPSLAEVITEEDQKFLNKIWEVYRQYNGIQLSTMTHMPNTPWDQTWDGSRDNPIPNKLIREHYEGKANSSV